MEISDKELADHLPNILDFVFQGGSVTVTHEGVAKIQIKPITDQGRLEYLISTGKVRPALHPGPIEFGPPFSVEPGKKSPLDYLLEERYGEDDD